MAFGRATTSIRIKPETWAQYKDFCHHKFNQNRSDRIQELIEQDLRTEIER